MNKKELAVPVIPAELVTLLQSEDQETRALALAKVMAIGLRKEETLKERDLPFMQREFREVYRVRDGRQKLEKLLDDEPLEYLKLMARVEADNKSNDGQSQTVVINNARPVSALDTGNYAGTIIEMPRSDPSEDDE